MATQSTLASGGTTSAEKLIRDARIILTNCGVPVGQSRLSRLVRTYQARVERNGFAFFDFLVNSVQVTDEQRRKALADPDVQRVISYADPTGETAVRNVLRSGELR
jgi:hypothetical protein